MIIESNIMTEMGINLLYNNHCIKRDGVCVPLKLHKGNYLTESTMKDCTICILNLPSFNR